MDLRSLPQDIVLLVLSYLEAHDLLRCQFVSASWKTFFSDDIYIRSILKDYTQAREVRSLLAEDPNGLHIYASPDAQKDLSSIFRTIASRYYHLKRGKVRKSRTERYPILALDQSSHWLPTPQWDYHESQPGGRLYHESASHVMSANRKPYLFRQSLWSYDDGIIVFAPRERQKSVQIGNGWTSREPWRYTDTGGSDGKHGDCVLAALDLGSRTIASIPFDIADRVIRNLRLKDGTLIIEWAEREPFHDLNLVDKVHRHFATIFDVRRQEGKTCGTHHGTEPVPSVTVVCRSEVKMHFLGLPLTARDHFFTTHTRNYYAMYLWQPNRSLWTGDEDQPIEALFVWDIRTPSTYRPSEDPGNTGRGQHAKGGPVMVSRFSFRELEFLGIRQRASIAFISLEIEELEEWGNIVWRENVFVSGQGYFDPAERNWRSRITRFPFEGEGPIEVRVGREELVAYRGAVSMESCELEEDEVEKWFLPVMDVVDREADIRFALLETCFSGMGIKNRIMVRIKVGQEGTWENMEGSAIDELSLMGRIAGDERWIVGMNGKLEIVVGRF